MGSNGGTTSISVVSLSPRLIEALVVLGGEDLSCDCKNICQKPHHGQYQLFAQIVWCRLAEPGDACAGIVIQSIGALEALEALLTDTSGALLYRLVAQNRGEISEPQFFRAIARWHLRVSRQASEQDVLNALNSGVKTLTHASQFWPEALNDLGVHAPSLLWTRGDPRLLSGKSLAVVGARAVTGYGAHVTAELVEGASVQGAPIISGAAFGVDAIAHRTALAAGVPTVAVVAGGVDRVYPAAHKNLFQSIVEQGVICAEPVLGSAPTRWRFLMRNRIIAALSVATLVTEAGVRSGSLNTAGHAAQLGRRLGAVPGSITSPSSAGCHHLIKQYNAEMITEIGDVLELLGQSFVNPACPESVSSEEPGMERQLSVHARVIDALPLRGSRGCEEIARHAGLSAREAMNALAELSVLGNVMLHVSEGGERRWKMVRSSSSTSVHRV